MQQQMRLRFHDPNLKSKLQMLADDLEVDLNTIVNMILGSYFSKKEQLSLQLIKDLYNFKIKENNRGDVCNGKS